MTTLAIASALPALFAVALSISTTNDYHYVTIPTNMAASLTGVGMGSEAPSEDAPLRYEDAAFLAEAYAERSALASSYATVTVAPITVSPTISLSVAHGIVDVGTGDFYGTNRTATYSTFMQRAYGNPTASLFSGCAEVDRYHPVMTNMILEYPAWPRIFNTTGYPFVEKSMRLNDRIDSCQTNGTPIMAEVVAGLYRDLAKLSRFCYAADGYVESGSKVTYQKEEDSSSYSTTWNGISHKWECGTATNDTEVTESDSTTPTVMSSLTISVGKAKARGFEDGKDVTGVYASSRYTQQKRTSSCNGIVMPFGPGDATVGIDFFNRQGGAKIVNVKCYASGVYSRSVSKTGAADDNKSGAFVVEVPIDTWREVHPFLFLEIGTQSANEAIFSQVESLFGDPGYEDHGDVLAICPDPAEPSSDIGEYVPTYSNATFVRDIAIYKFYVVYDMEFNARVPESESGNAE